MKITRVEIDRYGPLKDRSPAITEGMNILFGPNESGKTLFLEALLKLLEPGIDETIPRVNRLHSNPTGRLQLRLEDSHHNLDGEKQFSDLTPVDPESLRNIFVVRDADLNIPDQHAYFDSLTEKLGNIHTSEIDRIRAKLVEEGRLTSKRLNISDQYHDAKSVRNRARQLKEDIDDYLQKMKEEGIDDLETTLLQKKKELRDMQREHQNLEKAKQVKEHTYLASRLETFKEQTRKRQELQKFDEESLETLRDHKQQKNRLQKELEQLRNQLEENRKERKEKRKELRKRTEEVSALEKREPDIDETEKQLQAYRESRDESLEQNQIIDLTKWSTPAALVGSAIAGGTAVLAGSTLLLLGSGILLLIGAVLALLHYSTTRKIKKRQMAREKVLRTARDAGLEVDEMKEVKPAIETFRNQLDEKQNALQKLEIDVENLEEDVEEIRENIQDNESKKKEREDALKSQLEAADVEDVAEFRARKEERVQVEREQQAARQSLIDEFGEPEADDPEEQIKTWERKIREMVEDINVDEVNAETMTTEKLEDVKTRIGNLEGQVQDLERKLESHVDQVKNMEDRAHTLSTTPFLEDSIRLKGRSRSGLEDLRVQLEDLIETIENEAEISRKAIHIFEEIGEEEEEKISDLFESGGPASRYFRRFTGGNYPEVNYNAEERNLEVTRSDERVFSPEQLSNGTRDQLYLASRLSLAGQLIGDRAGFLLLDDAFLTADRSRLRNGFETLQQLVDEDWQILYFTAKEEVGEDMVEEFDFHRVTFDTITPDESASMD